MRRWIWVLVAFALALGAGVGAYKAIKPGQESNAQVLFVPSVRQPGVQGPTNPLENLGGSMGVVASIVQVAVSDDKAAQRLYQQGYQASYTVVPNLAENAGPVLLVTVTGKSASLVQRTLAGVLNEIKRQLKLLQTARNIPPDLFINAMVLTASAHPAPVHKAQIQKAVVATIGLLILLIVAILLIERALLNRRPRGRSRKVGDVDTDVTRPTRVRRSQPDLSDVPSRNASLRRSRRRVTRTHSEQLSEVERLDSESSLSNSIFASSDRPD